ncbi:MAG: hypothetical protein LBU32_17330 [Clostridiales bacterium]|jgi:hypothetical protein|nr:hypothetical protein [Clostridiales bacterium]
MSYFATGMRAMADCLFLLIIQRVQNAGTNRTTQWISTKKGTFDEERHRKPEIGGDAPNNLIALCKTCHSDYRDAAFMGIGMPKAASGCRKRHRDAESGIMSAS